MSVCDRCAKAGRMRPSVAYVRLTILSSWSGDSTDELCEQCVAAHREFMSGKNLEASK